MTALATPRLALGATPEALPFPPLDDALRTGAFEAKDNPVPTVVAVKFAGR